MRSLLITTLIAVSTAAVAQKPSKGTVEVGRVYKENDRMKAVATYTNDTQTTFTSVVTIACQALDKKGRVIAENKRSFFAHEHGPIEPGFTGSVTVPMNIEGVAAEADSARCGVSVAK